VELYYVSLLKYVTLTKFHVLRLVTVKKIVCFVCIVVSFSFDTISPAADDANDDDDCDNGNNTTPPQPFYGPFSGTT